jgi:hypothetical protein
MWLTSHPSISIDLLNAALDFISNYDDITDDERNLILHAKKSCLYNSRGRWPGQENIIQPV